MLKKARCSIGFICLAISLTLVGCNKHQNPLLSKEALDYLHNYYAFNGDDAFIPCQKHYGGLLSDVEGIADLPKKCEALSAKDFTDMQKNKRFPADATLEDFRDPTLWKAYLNLK